MVTWCYTLPEKKTAKSFCLTYITGPSSQRARIEEMLSEVLLQVFEHFPGVLQGGIHLFLAT